MSWILSPGLIKAGMTGHRTQSLRIDRFAGALGVALILASCASVQRTVGGWFGAAAPTPPPTPESRAATGAQPPRAYYAGVAGLQVYSEPSASSKVVGTLALHEKVTRSRLERGYAYVESAKGGVEGWVNNAQLLWRLPKAPTTTAPAPEGQPEEAVAPTGEEPQAPVAPEAAATAAEPTATPTNTAVAAPRSPTATPRGVAPSIFNPY